MTALRRLRTRSVRALSLGTDVTNSYAKGDVSPARHSLHRGARVPVRGDKDWFMGKSIIERLHWTNGQRWSLLFSNRCCAFGAACALC